MNRRIWHLNVERRPLATRELPAVPAARNRVMVLLHEEDTGREYAIVDVGRREDGSYDVAVEEAIGVAEENTITYGSGNIFADLGLPDARGMLAEADERLRAKGT